MKIKITALLMVVLPILSVLSIWGGYLYEMPILYDFGKHAFFWCCVVWGVLLCFGTAGELFFKNKENEWWTFKNKSLN